MSKRTFVDACLLLAAFRGKDDLGRRALAVLDDPDRSLIVSDAVWLEVFPKALFHGNQEEVRFFEAIFELAENVVWDTATLYRAHDLARKHGLAAMDAVHVAHALDAHVDELVTAEKSSKPMFRVPGLAATTIR